tara:strand:- start:308 stop:1012 length:705 start_codon:yes stop_codon:yes gene_type:complete
MQPAYSKKDCLINNQSKNNSSILSNIFKSDKNISIWRRELDTLIINTAKNILEKNSQLQFSEIVNSKNVEKKLSDTIISSVNADALFKDISTVVNIFCSLFDVKNAWLRLDVVEGPMCPRFHVDNVKCRLVSTYFGPGTEWLPNHLLDREKLGHGNQGELDEKSGLFLQNTDIEQLGIGHIGLLKGESWNNNQGNGLVHRSPQKNGDYKRLYMTIDFVDLYLKIYRNRLNRYLD